MKQLFLGATMVLLLTTLLSADLFSRDRESLSKELNNVNDRLDNDLIKVNGKPNACWQSKQGDVFVLSNSSEESLEIILPRYDFGFIEGVMKGLLGWNTFNQDSEYSSDGRCKMKSKNYNTYIVCTYKSHDSRREVEDLMDKRLEKEKSNLICKKPKKGK